MVIAEQNLYPINQPTTLKIAVGGYAPSGYISNINIHLEDSLLPINETYSFPTTTDSSVQLKINYSKLNPYTMRLHPVTQKYSYDVVNCFK